jgi:hypothetical protein
MVVYLVGKLFWKLRTNQVRGQEVHHNAGLPGGKKTFSEAQDQSGEGSIKTSLWWSTWWEKTVSEAQDQSGEGSINTSLWWSTWWANSSRSSGPIR